MGTNGARLYAKVKGTRWARSGIYLNMHDIMFVIARKRELATSKPL
jgi:hypothetical protein